MGGQDDRERLGQAANDDDVEARERERAERFVALHAQNQSRIAGFVHTLVSPWHDAEEIIQNTFVVLWRKFDEFEPSSSFFAWAARIAQFEVLNYRRENRRKTSFALDDDILEALAAEAIERMDDLDVRREALEHCIDKLADRDRLVVQTRYGEGGDVHAVAELLHRTTGHAQRVLRQIRGSLLRCVERRLFEIGL